MREDEDRTNLHQCRHAQGIAAVVREGQEGSAERNVTAMQRNAVHDCAHAEFAHTVVDVIARLIGTHSDAFFPVGQIGAGQISRAAQKFRQYRRQCLNRILAGFAGGDGFFFLYAGSNIGIDGLVEIAWQFALHTAQQLARLLRIALVVRLEQGIPLTLHRFALCFRIPAGVHIGRDFKRRRHPVQCFTRRADFLVT